MNMSVTLNMAKAGAAVIEKLRFSRPHFVINDIGDAFAIVAAALAAADPEPPQEGLDDVLADIEAMGWFTHLFGGGEEFVIDGWQNGSDGLVWRELHGYGDTRLAAANALKTAIRTTAGTTPSKGRGADGDQ